MSSIDYIGLDVHKKTVAYCVKSADGRIKDEGSVAATRRALTDWADALETPWIGAMEATLFTGWIYDHLRPHAVDLKVGHSLMLRAIVVSKRKSDRIDARKLADLLRCDLLPECHIAPPQIRELRRMLRFRNLLLRQAVRMKNRISGFLLEVGAEYTKSRLHGQRYFAELLESLEDVPESVVELLQMSRTALEMLQSMQRELIDGLREHPVLERRVERLMTIPGVGIVTALTWALEVGDPQRLPSVRRAISYCGLCSAQNSSAGKERRGPISKQRNSHLQRVLIEAAKLAPRYNSQLAVVQERELARGNRNRATIAVARKMVAYLLAVDKRQTAFEPTVAPLAAA